MPERLSDEHRNSATFAALLLVLTISAGLLTLIAFVLPQVLWIVIVAIALGLTVVLHYLVWGRWLSAKLRREEEENRERDERHLH